MVSRAYHNKHAHDQKGQNDAVRREALDFGFVSLPYCPGNNRRGPDPQAQSQAGDDHHNGKGKTQCR